MTITSIDEEQRKLVAAAGRAAEVLRHPLEKQSAVGQSCEHVVVGEMLGPLRGELVLPYLLLQQRVGMVELAGSFGNALLELALVLDEPGMTDT